MQGKGLSYLCIFRIFIRCSYISYKYPVSIHWVYRNRTTCSIRIHQSKDVKIEYDHFNYDSPLTFAFAKLFDFVLIICMVRISRGEEVEFRIVDLISPDPLLKTGTVSGYKARSLINNIFGNELRNNKNGKVSIHTEHEINNPKPSLR